MDFLIEKLRIKELPNFHQVFAQVLREGFDYSPKIIEHFINSDYSLANYDYWLKYNYKEILVAKADGIIVGFLVYDAPYGGVLFGRWLGVLPAWWGKGIGKKLVDEFIKTAQSLGCHKIEIASQPRSRDFYKKYGLAEEGLRKLSYFGIDQYLFGRVIGEVDESAIIKN